MKYVHTKGTELRKKIHSDIHYLRKNEKLTLMCIMEIIKEKYDVIISAVTISHVLHPEKRIRAEKRTRKWMRENKERTKESIKRSQRKRKRRALKRLANGTDYSCAICGCPHEEAFTIGHFNGDGVVHRKSINPKSGSSNVVIVTWIITAPIEEVLAKVRIECIYCNFYHARNGEYPPINKRPKW